ncbi:Pentatricopeptide repeat-containing protein, chloroplastic, partial [Cucurbita argyrosperma subsp. sororia]
MSCYRYTLLKKPRIRAPLMMKSRKIPMGNQVPRPKAPFVSIPEPPELRNFGSNLTKPGMLLFREYRSSCSSVLPQTLLKSRKEAILFNVTLKVFGKCRDMEGADKLFDEMLNRGAKPGNLTFSTIITSVRLFSLFNKAIKWFVKMPNFVCNPDDVTNCAMIDAYGRAGNVGLAFSLYDRARTENWRINPATFLTLIKIHEVAGNYDGCLNCVRRNEGYRHQAKLGYICYG